MKILKKLISILLVIVLTACSGSGVSTRSYYAYSIYPIGYLLNKIGGNRISTVSVQYSVIVQNATAVDDFSEILNESLYFYHIKGLEPYLDVYDQELNESGVNIVDLSNNSIYPFKRYTPVNVNGSLSFIESDYYEGTPFNYLDTYVDDLFIWLDPIGQ